MKLSLGVLFSLVSLVLISVGPGDLSILNVSNRIAPAFSADTFVNTLRTYPLGEYKLIFVNLDGLKETDVTPEYMPFIVSELRPRSIWAEGYTNFEGETRPARINFATGSLGYITGGLSNENYENWSHPEGIAPFYPPMYAGDPLYWHFSKTILDMIAHRGGEVLKVFDIKGYATQYTVGRKSSFAAFKENKDTTFCTDVLFPNNPNQCGEDPQKSWGFNAPVSAELGLELIDQNPDFQALWVEMHDPDLAGHLSCWGCEPYFKSIKNADNGVKDLVDGLKQRNLWQKTVLVLWTDHGGYQGTHGHGSSSESVMRAWYLIHTPDEHYVMDTEGNITDIIPTVSDLMELPHPPYSVGVSLVRPQVKVWPMGFFEEPVGAKISKDGGDTFLSTSWSKTKGEVEEPKLGSAEESVVGVWQEKGTTLSPKITLQGGDIFAAWSQDRYGLGQRDIIGKISNDGGLNWRLIQISGNEGLSQTPSVAINNGVFHVVWSDNSLDNNFEIFYKRSKDSGKLWEWQRVSNNTGNSLDPQIAVQGEDVYIVWEDDTPGNKEIFSQKSNDGGVTWQWQRISENSSASENPALAVKDELVLVTWDDNLFGDKEIFLKKSRDEGQSWEWQRISENEGSSEHPSVSVSSAAIWVTWDDDSFGNKEIFLKRSIDQGNNWEFQQVSSNPGNSSYPAIASSGQNVYLAWDDDTDGQSKIFYKKSGDAGNTWNFQKLTPGEHDTAGLTRVVLPHGQSTFARELILGNGELNLALWLSDQEESYNGSSSKLNHLRIFSTYEGNLSSHGMTIAATYEDQWEYVKDHAERTLIPAVFSQDGQFLRSLVGATGAGANDVVSRDVRIDNIGEDGARVSVSTTFKKNPRASLSFDVQVEYIFQILPRRKVIPVELVIRNTGSNPINLPAVGVRDTLAEHYSNQSLENSIFSERYQITQPDNAGSDFRGRIYTFDTDHNQEIHLNDGPERYLLLHHVGADNPSEPNFLRGVYGINSNTQSTNLKIDLKTPSVKTILGENVTINPSEETRFTFQLFTGRTREEAVAALLKEFPCSQNDLNCDGRLDLLDFLKWRQLWIQKDLRADLDKNGQINIFDYFFLLRDWLD